MKRHFFSLAALMLLAIIIVACTHNNRPEKKDGILGVADIRSDPASVKGTVVVTGVVARVSEKDKQLFSLIDTDEATHCKSTTCAKFYLPVQFSGPTPREWDEVNATGRIVERDGLLFQASKLDVLRHVTIE